MRRPFQLRVGESVAAMAVYVARTITCTNFRLDGTFAMLRDDRSRWRAVFRRHIAVESRRDTRLGQPSVSRSSQSQRHAGSAPTISCADMAHHEPGPTLYVQKLCEAVRSIALQTATNSHARRA